MKKTIYKLTVLSFFISAFIGVFLVFIDFYNDITSRVFLSFFSLFGFCVTALCSLIVQKRKKILSFIGVFLSLISFIYSLLIIWNILDNLFFSRILYSLISIVSFIALTCLLFFIKNDNLCVRVCRHISILITILLFILIIMNLWYISIPTKVFVAIICLLLIGIITTIIINGLYSNEKKVETLKVNKYQQLDELKELLDTLTISKADFDREKDRILNDGKKLKK